jgi:hypothetical protein
MKTIITVGVGLIIALTWLIETGWLRAQEWSVPNPRHELGYRRRHSVEAVLERGGDVKTVAQILSQSNHHLPVTAQLIAVTA